MNFTSKRAAFIILGITALVCSRVMFVFFHDSEGPNLLIVAVVAAVIYGLSLLKYRLSPASTGAMKLSLALLAQILVTLGIYLILNR